MRNEFELFVSEDRRCPSQCAQAVSINCRVWPQSTQQCVFCGAVQISVGEEVKIHNFPAITAEQIRDILLATLAFLPVMVCTGYLAAWFTNLNGFRQRSLVERIFWSVPLSLAVSTIASVLIGKFLSLAAVVVFLLGCALLWLMTLAREWLQLRRSGTKWVIGWRPLGGTALFLAVIWIAVTVISLADFQSNHRLFMNVAMLDQSYRVSWTEAILHTGIPPSNPLYLYKQPAPMRNYYFWYLICAAVAQMAHLSVRAVFAASCVWAGFVLAALNGLYLKHFLVAGGRLREQFLRSVALIMVTGFDICVVLWNLFYYHLPPPDNLEAWSKDPIISWFDTLLWSPNHVASLVCCMLALLLAWMAGKKGTHGRTAAVALIAAALASAFGLSIYVTFAFFLVMIVWGLWQVVIERAPQPALLLAAGGAGAGVLLLPYLWELTHSTSKLQGGSAFGFAVRQMIPAGGLLSSPFFQNIAAGHPFVAQSLARLVLLIPGYVLELGFLFIVFLIYLVPAWRGRIRLTPAQRSLLVIAVATIPFTTLIRSSVLTLNDFGFRSALFLQFPLLLLASEVITGWNLADRKPGKPAHLVGLPHDTPHWLRSIAALALIIGAAGTLSQALWFRFVAPVAEMTANATRDPKTHNLSHNLYISRIGYHQLDASIPLDAVVQFNPSDPDNFWMAGDLLGVDRQIVITSDQPWCGSELGGDPSGCAAMANAIDSLFEGTSADQAQATCRQYGIQYLVSRVYDSAWKDKNSWVWTLKPVVQDKEFRALDCR